MNAKPYTATTIKGETKEKEKVTAQANTLALGKEKEKEKEAKAKVAVGMAIVTTTVVAPALENHATTAALLTILSQTALCNNNITRTSKALQKLPPATTNKQSKEPERLILPISF